MSSVLAGPDPVVLKTVSLLIFPAVTVILIVYTVRGFVAASLRHLKASEVGATAAEQQRPRRPAEGTGKQWRDPEL